MRPGPEHQRLNVFVGRWNTEGQTRAGPLGPAARITAIDTYEWFPGGYFLLHHVDGQMGDAEVKALEVIGAGPREGVCLARSYDNAGQSDEFDAVLRGRNWTINGKTQRFRGQLSTDWRTLEGQWDLTEDGSTWRPWMRIRLIKR